MRALALTTLIFFILFTGFSFWFIFNNVKFNYELESFFPENDPSLEFYLEHLERFESDHDVLLVAITNTGGMFDTAFLSRVNAFHKEISVIPDVVKVFSPLKMTRFSLEGGIPKAIPFFHPGNKEKLFMDSCNLVLGDHFVKNFLSMHTGTLAIILKTKPGIGLERAKEINHIVENALESKKFDRYRMAGRPKAQAYIITNMQKEFFFLAGVTLLVLVLFLWLTFRNIWGIVLPVLTVFIGLVGTLDFMIIFSDGIDIFSIILPTVLFVVGVSDSVHILNNYCLEIGKGESRTDALMNTFRDISFSTFLTAITSAIGFITLITISIKPIAWFGINAAFGIILVYFISFTFLIAALVFVKPFTVPASKEIITKGFLERIFNMVISRKGVISIVFLVALIPISIGISRIQTNSYFTEELREGDPYKGDFQFFDENMGGVRPFEMSVKVIKPGYDLYSFEVCRELNDLCVWLEKYYGVGNITSPVSPLSAVNQMTHDGEVNAFCISSDSASHASNRMHLESMLDREEFRALVTPDLKWGRIAGRISDMGAIRVGEKNAEMQKFIARKIDTSLIELRLTGISTVLDSNNQYLTSNLMEGLIYELLTIGLLMGLLFRSVRMTIISLVPNVFPLIFIGGLLGWLDINLNLSSSIIFNIAFGITVDDTIHLLSGYKLQLRKGFSREDAFRRSYLHSGKAVAMTSFILLGGFIILTLSNFNGIYNTGILVSVTLVVALLSDLLLLPNLVRWLHK